MAAITIMPRLVAHRALVNSPTMRFFGWGRPGVLLIAPRWSGEVFGRMLAYEGACEDVRLLRVGDLLMHR